jgi:hypothetical protein
MSVSTVSTVVTVPTVVAVIAVLHDEIQAQKHAEAHEDAESVPCNISEQVQEYVPQQATSSKRLEEGQVLARGGSHEQDEGGQQRYEEG